MEDKIATTQPAEVVETYEGQVALFDDPQRLLRLGDGEYAQLTAAVCGQARQQAAQMRRIGGLMAWSGWHRLGDRAYSKWLVGLAADFDVSERTMRRWREAVIEGDGLPVPTLADLKTGEDKAAIQTKKGRSEGSPGHSVQKSEPIPDPRPAPVQPALEATSPKPEPFTLGSLLGYLKTWDSSTLKELPYDRRGPLRLELRRWLDAIGEGTVGFRVHTERRPDELAKGEKCMHLVTRRLGSGCAACGAENVGKK